MRWLPAIALSLVFAAPASAGFFCGIDGGFPSVDALYVENGQLRALVAAYRPGADQRKYMGKQLVLRTDGTWSQIEDAEIPRREHAYHADQCLEAPVDEAWIRNYKHIERLDSWFAQHIGACAVDGHNLWGGISFYAGEGSWGVGGLVRKDLESGRIHTFRPPLLADVSVSHIATFAGHVWIGTAHFGECGIQEVANGVRRYSPGSGFTGAFAVPEICGFAVNDFVVHDNALWTATEMGLTKLSVVDGELSWQHYAPDLSRPQPMRPVACIELYEEILMSNRLANGIATDDGPAFESFWRRLTNLRPDFVWNHLRKLHGHPPVD